MSDPPPHTQRFRCPFLHRTTGDTERRYHLRYYKTGICIHETDSKGNCTKNGLHCAFAHGPHDLRSPVYDIRWAGCHAGLMALGQGGGLAPDTGTAIDGVQGPALWVSPHAPSPLSVLSFPPRELQAMEALQNGQTTVEGSTEGQTAGAASHAMIEKILSEEPRWQGKGGPTDGRASSCPVSVPSPLLPGAALRVRLTAASSSHLAAGHSPSIRGVSGEFLQTCLARKHAYVHGLLTLVTLPFLICEP